MADYVGWKPALTDDRTVKVRMRDYGTDCWREFYFVPIADDLIIQDEDGNELGSMHLNNDKLTLGHCEDAFSFWEPKDTISAIYEEENSNG